MEQELKIVIKDENIILTQKHDGKRHEIANRSFKQNEWNKMINAFQTTFIQPKTFAFTEIDWWVAVDGFGRGNWTRNFYKLVVTYENGFQYKFRTFQEINAIFGMKFKKDTTFHDFKITMKRIHAELKNEEDPAFNIGQTEFDVS